MRWITQIAMIATSLTAADLRLDPVFDPPRSDPRFQKLCEEKQPAVKTRITRIVTRHELHELPRIQLIN
jgi:hypothetical protein